MKTPLNIHDPWPLLPDLCAADLDFLEWVDGLDGTLERPHLFFHMGPGSHHIVGRTLAALPAARHITALSLSPAEVWTYVCAAAEDAELARKYHVLFGDIHTIGAATLPTVEVSTLFHVGEIWRETPDADAIESAMRTVRHATVQHGRIVFYRGSSAWDRVEPVVRKWVDIGRLAHIENFKGLSVYRRRI